MRRDNFHYFVYPEYFDQSLTRKEGRRLPLSIAIENPTLLEIKLAAEKMEYKYEIKKDSAYSRQWWNPKGLILIENKEPKQQLLVNIGKTVKNIIRPALEKQKKEIIKEAKKPKIRPQMISKPKSGQESKDFKPKRRR